MKAQIGKSENIKYPYFGLSNNIPGRLVLFTGPGTGVQICEGNPEGTGYRNFKHLNGVIGEHWIENNFTPVQPGEVIEITVE